MHGKTPKHVVKRLEAELCKMLEEPAIRARIAELGGEVQAVGTEAFRRRLRADTEQLGAIIRANNIRLDQ